MTTHLKIDYVEFATQDLPATQAFLAKAFAWTFTDYGPDYQAFANAGLEGGIQCDPDHVGAAPLVILKAENLEAAEQAVTAAGGTIIRPIFSFPGGRRFHFREPGGNEMAVWSET
ncbi:MAG: VOC family protein [Hyphomonadaceae bacterium]